ncbi:hypothetical protein A3F66_05060 [candidate division TM6 bacterium RIFCSPHIGHO2_12_FULL_32_22]|nr:MAG: hypothetical protein A3F66_05060 [candidate division TM6 bacterium RIFCSPHIGHO2_12_FULL_32_22]
MIKIFYKILLVISVACNIAAGPVLTKPVKPLIEDPDYYLLAAVKRGNLNKVRDAIKAGANTNPIENGKNALMIAAFNGNLDIVKLLLENGANPNFINNESKTPLMITAESEHNAISKIPIIKILLQAGSDIKLTDIIGKGVFNYIDVYNDKGFLQSALRLDNYRTIRKILSDTNKVQYKINKAIESGLVTESEALNLIFSPIDKSNFQVALNYLLYKIKTEHDPTLIPNIRKMLITAAHRIAKLVIPRLNSLEIELNAKESKLKKAIKKQLPGFEDLPDDVKQVIFYQILLKQNFPYTNFDTLIPIKDGSITNFSNLIAEEIRIINMTDSGEVCASPAS